MHQTTRNVEETNGDRGRLSKRELEIGTVSGHWVGKGTTDKAPVALDRDLYVTIPRGQYSNLAAELELQTTLFPPLSTDQSVGRVRVNLENELIAEANLYPVSDVALGGLWDRMIDEVMLWFE